MAMSKRKDAVFCDSRGRRIREGDTIRIVTHYVYPHLNGREARVFWDSEHGLYYWISQESRHGKVYESRGDFYVVNEFEKVRG